MTRQITPEVLERALAAEHRGDPRPAPSVLRQLLRRLAEQGTKLEIVPRR